MPARHVVPHLLVRTYPVIALLTLIFQIYVRSSQCSTYCASGHIKAIIWSVIWPFSWIVYLAGVFGITQ
jgi:hypothetical protein